MVGLRIQWVCEDAGGHRVAGQKSQEWEAGFHAEAWGLGPCLVAQLLKNSLQCGRPQCDPWVEKIPQRRDRLPTPVFLGFHGV